MLKKIKYFIGFCFIFLSACNAVEATTIKETVNNSDEFDTIERNTTIIGVSKFSSDTVITASKASIAGSNDAKQYFEDKNTFDGYDYPQIYIYYGSVGGWYSLDDNNNVSYVTDKEILKELSEIDIYYVNNVEKVITIDYSDNIDETKLPSKVKYKNGKLYINATLKKFDIYNKNGKKVNYIYDKKSSSYIVNYNSCFKIDGNSITDYDENCGSDVTIPSIINDVIINSISDKAFDNKNIKRVTIPKEIVKIGDNAFDNNPLSSVIINDKYSLNDFNSIGSNVFGNFSDIHYDNVLTRALTSIDNNYKINVYKDFDTSLILDNYSLAYIISRSITLELQEKGYNFVNKTRNYDLNGSGSLELKVENSNDTYTLILENTLDNKKYSVSKVIVPSYNKLGNIETMNVVTEAIKNIKEDETIDEFTNEFNKQDYVIVTNFKNLSAIEKEYDIDFLYEFRIGSSLSSNDGLIESGFAANTAYVFKDNVLYSRIRKIAVMEPWSSYEEPFFVKHFYPPIKYSDYSDINAYIDAGLKLFENRTGVTNYDIKITADGNNYKISDIGFGKYIYIVTLLNADGNEIWQLFYNS